MSSIERARKEVQRGVAELLAVADDGREVAASETEAALWTGLLALGRALFALFLAQQAARPRPMRYDHLGAQYEIVGRETAEVGCRFGKVLFERPVARPVGSRRGARDLPLDRELGFPAGFTTAVVFIVAKLATQMAFASARALFRDIFAWAPSPRAALRMVDAVGARARPFLEATPPPDKDGEVLVITVDGKGAPAISSKEYARRARPHAERGTNRRHARRDRRREVPKKRRGPGDKSKNAKMAAVGVLYTLRRDADGRLEGPVNKRVYSTFESYRALFEWLKAEAVKRGYGTSKFKRVLFIADGADVLWRLQAEYFPEVTECIDWFHVVEKLWSAGKAICRDTRRRRRPLEAWVAAQKKLLRAGHVAKVVATLEAALAATAVTGPGNKFRREMLSKTLAYFAEHAPRMQYARLRRDDLEIGSGVIEGAVRHLIGVRLDGPGMRWGRDRAEAILHLRCVLINGLWPEFERHLDAAGDLRLLAQPVPTRTHDAVLKNAA